MQRRDLFKKTFLSAVGLTAISKTALAAAVCLPGTTPNQMEGPFYPKVMGLNSDTDLITLNGSTAAALGEIVIVEGIVTDQNCNPVPGALVEIWQACASGRYNHSSDPNPAPLDPNFQYWGKAVTDAQGFYRFRTIIPGAYPADVGWDRPPHIHFKIAKVGYVELITQMYFKNEPLNAQDLILQALSKADQDKVIVDFQPVNTQAHPVGTFDIQIRKIK